MNSTFAATEQEITTLENAYKGRKAFHGELHDHSASGGTSDGECTLAEWKENLAALDMDFAAILDHRQIRHMYLPDWDDRVFICGSEPGTVISDSGADRKGLHYNMIFPTPDGLIALLKEFPEYAFTYDTEGTEAHFVYPSFTRERFAQLAERVFANGGFFVIPHPKQVMESDNPLDYWFRDYTGLEAIYVGLDTDYTKQDYALWVSLLSLGKRLWACAGGDLHAKTTDGALTTIYAEEKRCPAYIPHLRAGDFTAGSVGIRMLCGNIRSGGHGHIAGQRVVLSVGDFHRSVKYENHSFRLDIFRDDEILFSAPVSADGMNYFAFDCPDCGFIRAEVTDESRSLRIAIGNPIWNDR